MEVYTGASKGGGGTHLPPSPLHHCQREGGGLIDPHPNGVPIPIRLNPFPSTVGCVDMQCRRNTYGGARAPHDEGLFSATATARIGALFSAPHGMEHWGADSL